MNVSPGPGFDFQSWFFNKLGVWLTAASLHKMGMVMCLYEGLP